MLEYFHDDIIAAEEALVLKPEMYEVMFIVFSCYIHRNLGKRLLVGALCIQVFRVITYSFCKLIAGTDTGTFKGH